MQCLKLSKCIFINAEQQSAVCSSCQQVDVTAIMLHTVSVATALALLRDGAHMQSYIHILSAPTLALTHASSLCYVLMHCMLCCSCYSVLLLLQLLLVSVVLLLLFMLLLLLLLLHLDSAVAAINAAAAAATAVIPCVSASSLSSNLH
jgi:hypothetical protein